MKSFYDGYEYGKALCRKVELGEISIKRVLIIAKKRHSEFEDAKINACVDWLWQNKELVRKLKNKKGIK